MKILHLVSYPIFSGPLPSTLLLAEYQKKLGHEVWLAIDRKRRDLDAFEEAAWESNPNETNQDPASPLTRIRQLEPQQRFTLSTHNNVFEFLRDRKTLSTLSKEMDIIHTHLSHDHLISSISGIPKKKRIRTIHSARSLSKRFGQTWLFQLNGGIIVRSNEHQNLLTNTFNFDLDRTAIVCGCVNTEQCVKVKENIRREIITK